MNHIRTDDISLAPLIKELQGYSYSKLQDDLFAGLTVALVALPQAMACALIAGLPLSCGLLAAVFTTLVSALFGSARNLIVGPSTAIAMLVLGGTADILFTFYRHVEGAQRDYLALQILTQMTLLVGVFQLFASLFKLGRLTQFVSHSVIVGYLAGTAMAVIITQLFVFLGFPLTQELSSLYDRVLYIFTHIKDIHLPTACVGLGSLLLLVILKRMNSKVPSAVVVLILASLAVHFLGFSNLSDSNLFGLNKERVLGTVPIVGDTGELNTSLPSLQLPFFNTGIMNHLLPIAFAIALLSALETTAVAKSASTNTGQRLSVNQEIFGLGLGNLVAAFIGAIPCSGSASRSALFSQTGAKTRLAVISSAILVGLLVLCFSYFITRVPLTALSAILLVSAMNIVNLKQFFLCINATRSDAFVLIATLFACFFFSLEVAFYIGIILSITLYLKKAAIPHLLEYTFDASAKNGHKLIRVINVQGELFFGAADLFQSTLKTIAEDDTSTKVIILRLKNARDIDATACLAIQQLFEYLKGSGRHLLACGLTYHSWRVLCDSGLVEQIGKENLFILEEQNPQLSLRRALWRAQALLDVVEEKKQEIEIQEEMIPILPEMP